MRLFAILFLALVGTQAQAVEIVCKEFTPVQVSAQTQSLIPDELRIRLPSLAVGADPAIASVVGLSPKPYLTNLNESAVAKDRSLIQVLFDSNSSFLEVTPKRQHGSARIMLYRGTLTLFHVHHYNVNCRVYF